VAGVIWAIYTHFSDSESPPSETTNITASKGGIAAGGNISAQAEPGGTAVITTGNVRIDAAEIAKQLVKTHERELTDYRQREQKYQLREQEYQDQIKALTETVTALAQQRGKPDAPPGIDEALKQLAEGNTSAAETIFCDVAKKKEAEGAKANQEAAEALRHLGALAFLNDTQKALDAYRRSTELDPENPEGWNQLGHLLQRTGELAEAEEAYQKVVAIGQSENDQEWIAIGSGNLGVVDETRGELEKAEAMHQKALTLDEEMGHKEDLANDYTNLGNVYETRGDLEKAEAMYQKALALFQDLGIKPQVEYVQDLLTNLKNL
jgi:tetratricopeptide (TPR) repeat protein